MQSDRSRLFATDKELFDLLFSSKKRITEKVLHRITRERGVFFGSEASRDDLSEYISTTIHDLQDVVELVKDAEPGTRGFRTSSTTVKMKLDASEINEVIREYADTDGIGESVSIPQKTANTVVTSVAYSEFDLSRTTLAQRQDKVATLDIRIEEDGVNIRYPGSNKGQELVDNFVERLERKKKSSIVQERISVENLSPLDRTRFFVNLATRMPDFKLDTVTKLKVSSETTETIDLDSDESDHEQEDAENAMINLVKNVALNGNDLLVSKQYNQMKEDGFFIVAIRWQATQTSQPFDKVEFEALFGDAPKCTDFQYRARLARRSERTGTYPINFKLPDDAVRKLLFSVIEQTARSILADIRSSCSTSSESD